MRVLFDTNVLLDALLVREPFIVDSDFLLNAIDAQKIEGFVSATTITDVHYLVRRQTKSMEKALNAVAALLASMQICPVNRKVLEQAVALKGSDFEDNVQIACAISLGLNAIVTRDASGFAASLIPIMSPAELKMLILEQEES